MKPKLLYSCALLLLLSVAAHAQQSHKDPLGENFFSPELVMQNQEAIGLSEQQKADLKDTIRHAQLEFTERQWKLQDEMEKLVSLVKQPHVDEQAALAQLDKVLAAEREIKREQVRLMVLIKNELTPEQQAKLQKIRDQSGSK